MRAIRNRITTVVAAVVLAGVAACSGANTDEDAGGDATVVIAGKTYKVGRVQFHHAFGEGAYFRFDGIDAARPDTDCLPGLGGTMALYGDLPADITSVAQLAGRDLPFEFSGDGDDANLCFVGTGGLLGVERGAVTVTAVKGDQITFTFTGRFVIYDGEGGQSPGEIEASGRGTARVVAH